MANIIVKNGDILASHAEVLVNPVNCVGVMGAGLAKQFKDKYPLVFREYRRDCLSGRLKVGTVLFYRIEEGRWMAAFPTKHHWRHPSRIEWIEQGLMDLRNRLSSERIRSVAVPALGAGLGQLHWSDVRPLIMGTLNLPEVTVEIYEPVFGSRRSARKGGVSATTKAEQEGNNAESVC